MFWLFVVCCVLFAMCCSLIVFGRFVFVVCRVVVFLFVAVCSLVVIGSSSGDVRCVFCC